MSSSGSGPASVFVEVADRVWVARHDWYDVNVTAIGGSRGLVVVDTHSSDVAGRGVVEGLRRLGAGDVVAVVDTHAHHDHVLGNRALATAYDGVPVHAHETCAATMTDHLRTVRDHVTRWPADEAHRDELLAALADPVLPEVTFSSVAVLDLGDRAVELVHPGRGHTAGDLVVRVGDADVLLAGDLVEAADEGTATPDVGDDSHLLEWPLTLDLVLQLLGPDTVVVPGHGPVVDREHVRDQRAELGVVAETIRDLAGRGVPVGDALGAAEWPWPTERLTRAVPRAYAQLPRAQKRLPLV